jgi:hypothetical protein
LRKSDELIRRQLTQCLGPSGDAVQPLLFRSSRPITHPLPLLKLALPYGVTRCDDHLASILNRSAMV